MCPELVSRMERAERVRSILASKGLTLSKVSQRSRLLYGHSSPYFLPHNLYYDLRLQTFSPSIYQILALSHISGYRLDDWLRVFGFEIGNIPILQVQLPCKRTVLLDSSLDDPNSWILWLRNRTASRATPPIAPLAQLVEFTNPRRLHSLSHISNQGFLYAKIGEQDALALPDLLPGSIVRVNPRLAENLTPLKPGSASDQIFLLEHSNGFCCCRLRVLEHNRIVPVSTQLPYPRLELQRSREVRIRGVVDLEIRSLAADALPVVPREMVKAWRPEPIAMATNLGHLVRGGRRRAALSFREASALSRQIADLLGNGQYFISPSSLSDCETNDVSPRHFHKVITLCALYALDLPAFLKTAGIVLEDAGNESIPDQLLPRPLPTAVHTGEQELEPAGFLQELLGRLGEVPLFLRPALGTLSGLAAPSPHDFFWIGGLETPIPTYLKNGLLVAVHRRKKRPRCNPSKPPWEQLLYLVLKRDGRYLCGCCEVENRSLLIHPSPEHFDRSIRLRYPQDAEVIGQIVAVVRKLL